MYGRRFLRRSHMIVVIVEKQKTGMFPRMGNRPVFGTERVLRLVQASDQITDVRTDRNVVMIRAFAKSMNRLPTNGTTK